MSNISPIGAREWRNSVQMSSTGSIKPNLFNACLALRFDPAFSGAICFNELTLRPVIRRAMPWNDKTGRDWDPHDDNSLNEWLQREDININLSTVQQAVEKIAYENRFHPIRLWMNGLTWDGKPRIDNWLTYYLGTEKSSYSQDVGRAWLISAVARIMKPGCKADHVLILEGRQGLRKSTALRTLAGEEYFTDELADFGSKDANEQLRGVWIIELGELDHFTRSEATAIKAFLSRTVDRFRPSYGRRVIEAPRECIFCGSGNQDEYFKDETGNRRFWPIKCGPEIDIDALAADREQLWAEAVSCYRNGEPWWLADSDAEDQARAEQMKRQETDVWDETILDWVRRQTVPPTTTAILTCALGFKEKDVTRREQVRITKIMKTAGFERRTFRNGPCANTKTWQSMR